MKIRVSMQGAYMVMELEDGQARRMFWKMAELLRLAGGKKQPGDPAEPDMRMPETRHEERKQTEVPPAENPAAVDSVLDGPELAPLQEEAELLIPPAEEPGQPEPEEAPQPAKMLYKGFMYIKCPNCEEARGYFTRTGSERYFCKTCGETTFFDAAAPLVPIYVRCECGKGFRYMTNMTDTAFDINCLDCGAPVAVKWNEKKGLYETIREGM